MNIIHLLKIKSDVAYIYESNTLRQGLEKMKRYGYTAIPVITKDGDYAGTVTEGDFLWHIIEKGRGSMRDQEDYYVRNILRTDFMTAVSITATAEELIEKATNQNFVPVVDDRNKFIGIITRRDIIRYFVQKHQDNYKKS